jgi:ribosome maturation factor RimP
MFLAIYANQWYKSHKESKFRRFSKWASAHFLFPGRKMTTRRRKIQEKARETAGPALEELGLAIVDVEFLRRDGSHILCFYLDRPGGITVDDLQQASRSIESILEVSDVVDGPFRLEVSSPGIDRPLRSREDFQKRVGTRVKIKLFDAISGGRRNLTGAIVTTENDTVIVRCDGERDDIPVALENIARARPVIDWKALFKGSPPLCSEADSSERGSS